MKVLITDTIADECLQKIKKEGLEADYRPSADENELRQALKDADALIVRSGTKVTSSLLENAPALKVIGRAGTGVDNIDIPAATERGILVMNSPSGNTISAAEHTFAIMLSLARNIHTSHDSIKEGRWDRKKYKGIELYGKTLGIIGLGRIGREVLKRALAFGMKVITYDPYVSESGARDAGCEKVDLNTLLKTADIITVHIPLNAETEALIAYKELSMMKKNALLINSARGGIVN
ncbi:MAG: hydroxyacid dehydrogenase, partial [Elusimicrobiota bacterium]